MRRFIFRVLLVFACVFLFQIAAYAQKEKAWAKLEPLKTSFIKGEPIYITFIRYGTPYSGDFYLDGKLCHSGGDEARPDWEATTKSVASTQKEPQFSPETRKTTAPLRLLCDLKIKEMQNRAYELCYKDQWVEGCASFSLEESTGEDAEVYKKMNPNAHDLTDSGIMVQEIIDKHPTSTYTGWLLRNWQPDIEGVFGKNETAMKMILAVIMQTEEDLHRYWRLDVPLPEGQKVRDRKVVMRQLVEYSEAFVNANPDFLFSGWILARAGFNALGLSDFRTACVDLKRSLQLGWNLPGASKNAEPSYKEGTTYALELMRKHGHCKKD